MITKKEIIKVSLPTIIALSSSTLMGIVNLMIIGTLNFTNTAVVGLANMFCQNIIIVIVAFSFQVTVVVSKHIGAKRFDKLHDVGKESIYTTILFNTPIIILLLIFVVPIMKVLGASDEMIQIGKLYFCIRIVSILFISLSRSLIGFLRGLEKTMAAMYVTIVSNIVNVLIGYVCVHVFTIGLLDIGLSIMLSEIFQMIALYIIIKKEGYHFFANGFHFVFQKSKALYVTGLQIGIQDVGISLTTIFFTIFAAKLGTKQLAATEVALNLLSLAYLPGIAIGVSASTQVAKLVGDAANTTYETCMDLRRKLLTVTSYFTLPFALMGGIFGRYIALAFTSDVEVQGFIALILFVAMFFLLFDAFQMVLMDGDRGFGENRQLMGIALLLGIVFFVPVCYVMTFVLALGLLGMWLSFYIYILVQCFVLYWFYTKEAKKRWSVTCA